jgi:hypothetical protein
MHFKSWILTEYKYHNFKSIQCGECSGSIVPTKIAINPKHIYMIGQYFTCDCKQSSLWTNSIRNEEKLLAFLKGESERYYNGFCNDDFCGFCYSAVQPLQNGFPWNGKRYDRYGCALCKQNDKILVDGSLKTAEGAAGTKEIMNWYEKMLPHWEKLVKG